MIPPPNLLRLSEYILQSFRWKNVSSESSKCVSFKIMTEKIIFVRSMKAQRWSKFFRILLILESNMLKCLLSISFPILFRSVPMQFLSSDINSINFITNFLMKNQSASQVKYLKVHVIIIIIQQKLYSVMQFFKPDTRKYNAIIEMNINGEMNMNREMNMNTHITLLVQKQQHLKFFTISTPNIWKRLRKK